MTDREIIDLLERTGHLEWPFGKHQRIPEEVRDLDVQRPLRHPAIAAAIGSYQDFLCECLDPLCLKHHSRPARRDHQIGPATIELMGLPRCGCHDYGPDVAAMTGSGSWKGCHDVGDYHAATIYVDIDTLPDFLEPHWETIVKRVVAAFEDVGLRFTFTLDRDLANIVMSFVKRSNGWIGLAIVGSGQSCGSQIWCRFLSTYQPRDILGNWVILLLHELMHNCGGRHTRGGIMKPVLTPGLAASWRGDPSEPILRRMFGGVPIPSGPDFGEYWISHSMRSNRGRESSPIPITPPIPVGDQ